MDIHGQHGELLFTLEVTRAETGETEVFRIVGSIGEQPTGEDNGSNTLDSGT